MTIDTTRLRALTEAVRDAGEALAIVKAAILKATSVHELTRTRQNHQAAAEALRGAQKALYRDAPPDGIILALLDEVERLRAIFDDAGQGEHNVLALVEHYQQAAMEADERLGLAYPRALQAAADVVLNADVTMAYLEPDESEILAWVDDIANDILELTEEQIEAFDAKVERDHAEAVAPKPERPVVIWHWRDDEEELPACDDVDLEQALEDLDEEHSDGSATKPTPAMIEAADAFASAIEREYVSWACEVVEKRVVNVREWCAAHRPEWLAQLPAIESEEGGAHG